MDLPQIEQMELKLLNEHQNWLAEQQQHMTVILASHQQEILLLSVAMCGILLFNGYVLYRMARTVSDGKS